VVFACSDAPSGFCGDCALDATLVWPFWGCIGLMTIPCTLGRIGLVTIPCTSTVAICFVDLLGFRSDVELGTPLLLPSAGRNGSLLFVPLILTLGTAVA